MIYIDYQKEKIIIDNTGTVKAVGKPSKLSLKGTAVFFDSSSISEKDDESCKFYNVRDTEDGKLYFLNKDDRASGCKSLLYALGVRAGVITGIYFSDRLLLFAIKGGELQKRFTSDDVNDPAGEISYTIKRWGLPEDTVVEVYGHNIELGRLFDNINRCPLYLNRSSIYKAQKIKEIMSAVGLIIMALCVYWYIHLTVVSTKKSTADIKKKTKAMDSEIKAEAVKRLPLYLSSTSVPFDAVLRSLSFLENCNYTNLTVTVDEHGGISAKATVINPDDAYKIKTLAKHSTINAATGGVIEVNISEQIQIPQITQIPGGGNYTDYFNF